jgi:tellurite resistance protein
MTSEGDGLLGRVVASIASSVDPAASGQPQKSILNQAASAYARKPSGAESTIPTGFDPRAASLFEAVVEAAFLVANADGDFDDAERQIFERVVHEACQNTVQRGDVSALVSDLLEQLQEDGVEGRIKMVSGIIDSPEHAHEVLRIAALMAHISGGVDATERTVMDQLATGFGLDRASVQSALDQAAHALAT